MKTELFTIHYRYKGGKLGKPWQIGTRTKFPKAEAELLMSSDKHPKACQINLVSETAKPIVGVID